MSEAQASIFGGQFEAAKRGSTNSERWILPGEYVVTVGNCKHIDGHSGKSFVAELLVEESNNPSRPKGSSMDFVRKFGGQYPGLSYRDCREFIAEATEIPFEDVKEMHYKNVVHSKQPLRGTKLALSAVNTTSKSGRPFTKLSWRKVK